MLRETLARFVREELIPLKPIVIRHEAERGLTDTPLIPPEAEKKLTGKAKEIGLYGIDVPILKARPLPRLHKQSRRHRNSVATFAMEPS